MKNMDTAMILAGGKSKRMGFDKQFLMLDDQLIMNMLTDTLKNVFKEIIIVTNKPEEYKNYPYKIVTDQYKEYGPLAGLHVGLKESNSLYNYVIACDMPCININYIQYMKKLIHKSSNDVDAVVTRFGEWIEPFNGFYSKKLIVKIEKCIKEDKKRIVSIYEGTRVMYIKEERAREFSPNWEMFMNINRQEDLEKYLDIHNRRCS